MDKPSPEKARDESAAFDDGEAVTGSDAWASYRRWLAGDGTAANRRAPVERSIYSWKGYQNWADRVRQSWKSES